MNNGARVLLLVLGEQNRRNFKADHVTSMDIRHFPGTLREEAGYKYISTRSYFCHGASPRDRIGLLPTGRSPANDVVRDCLHVR